MVYRGKNGENKDVEQLRKKKKYCLICKFGSPAAIEWHHPFQNSSIAIPLCCNCHNIVTKWHRNHKRFTEHQEYGKDKHTIFVVQRYCELTKQIMDSVLPEEGKLVPYFLNYDRPNSFYFALRGKNKVQMNSKESEEV